MYGIVLTGRTPAETAQFLQTARAAFADKLILAGGGVTATTLAETLRFANGAIVSSALKTENSLFGTLTGFFANTSENQGGSVSNERQRLLNAQLFRALSPDHAVALLTVNGSAFDDVIRVPQITSDDLA